MKIVGVNMDNLDNNLDMVTKGQQQQQQPRRMLQILEYNIGNGQLSDVTGSAHVMNGQVSCK